MLDDLSDEAVDVIVRHATDSTSPLTLNVLRHAGGAMAPYPPETRERLCELKTKYDPGNLFRFSFLLGSPQANGP